ncbi:MAG: GNAT family N-acetyltransferase [Candidatus Azobacteroides sp.]|nr:GNAT family N-acetyltransferase [Candidatus Azobacteroides sp.]
MITFSEIKDMNNEWWNKFIRIYSTSFPVYEQRSIIQQETAFMNPRYHLFFTHKEDKIQAFISFWDFDEYIYIEHFAVNQELRGQHIGSETLVAFKEKVGKRILLEIDPVTDEISRKRLSFYEKLNFKVNPYIHLHPPYDPAYPPHELVVLTSDKPIFAVLYQQFKNDLEKIVMK